MKTVKGFKDVSGKEAEKRESIRKILVETFEKYGFEAAETPVIEYEKFVKGDNSEDEAVSDIFKLKDKGKRKLALRYEFTFQLKRLMKNKKLPYKRYSIGPVFRDEPVSTNRLRQFTQADVDIIGVSKIPAREEAEILALTNNALKKLRVQPEILVNNRTLLNEILESEKIKEKDREQVLREIDKYDKLPEKQIRKNLKKYKAERIIDCLKKGEKYFDKFQAYKEIISLIDYCRSYKIKVKFSPTLVRGLSYYKGSIFEVKAKGIKESLAAGGSYEFNGKQCTGIAFGLERLFLLADLKNEKEKYLIISLEQERKAIKVAEKLRKKGNRVSIYYGKPSKALEYANSYNYTKAVFIGSQELDMLKKDKIKVKDLKTGKEKVVRL